MWFTRSRVAGRASPSRAPLAAVLLCSSAVAAADSIVLKPKYEPGRSRYVELTEATDQKLTGPMFPEEGMIVSTRQVYGMVCRVERADEKGAHLTCTYDRMAMEVVGPMGPMKFDTDAKPASGDEAADEALADILRPMVGMTVKIELGPDGRGVSASGMKELVAKIDAKAAGNFMWANMREQLTDDMFRFQMGDLRAACYANKEVKVGDSWTNALKVTFPQIGDVEYEFTCKLAAIEKKDGAEVAVVEYEGKAASAPGSTPPPNPMMTMKLDSISIRGAARFDAKAGEFVEDDHRADMKLTMTMPGPGEGDPATSKMDMKMKVSIRSMPLAEREKQKGAAR